jgi:hypothetical protein
MPATSRTTVAKANLCPLSASFCGHRSQHCRLASGCDPGKCCSSPHLLTFGHLQHGLLHSRNFYPSGLTATLSAAAGHEAFRVYLPLRMIAVYASRPPSPTTTGLP